MTMQKRAGALAVAMAAVLVHTACGDSKSPSSPATNPPTTTVTTSAVSVTGTAPRVGDTAPFAASATLSDGSSRTVTAQATWQSSNASVATVSSAGLVAGVGEGDVEISATYENVRGEQRVSVTTRVFALSGVIADATDSRPIAGATVEVIAGANAGRSSDAAGADGRYQLSGLRPGELRLRARAPEHDFGDQSVTIANADARADFTLRATATPQVAQYDPSFAAPSCTIGASSCDSGTLLNRRGPTEANQPNTVFSSCPDGQGNGNFVSVEAINVATSDASALAGGKSVRVSVSYYAFTTAAALIVSHAPDATKPVFTEVFRKLGAAFEIGPRPATVSFSFVLPAGATQAFRAAAVFDKSDDDCDDLVIRVR
jgi:hypothetical protein